MTYAYDVAQRFMMHYTLARFKGLSIHAAVKDAWRWTFI
jgi:hypothetical protein